MPGPKSGAVLIMAPWGWGLGAGVGEDPEFCLIITGEASCVYVPWFRHSFLKLHFRPVMVYVDESFSVPSKYSAMSFFILNVFIFKDLSILSLAHLPLLMVKYPIF